MESHSDVGRDQCLNPNGQAAIIEEAGHNLAYEQNEATVNLIRELMDKNFSERT